MNKGPELADLIIEVYKNFFHKKKEKKYE